jgi:glycosyl-4,4'-diaponeurosporenoate acyltransferase
MRPALIVVNVIGWPILQMGIAWLFTRIRITLPPQSNILARVSWREVSFYRSALKLNQWKHRLPDGAAWVGGSFSKQSLQRRDDAYLTQFAAETWRGELAHWVMFLLCPIFFLWNPLWADGVMIAYAVLANIPCILAQRYNRYTFLRILKRRKAG